MLKKELRDSLAKRLRLQISLIRANGSNCDHLLRRLNKLVGN